MSLHAPTATEARCRPLLSDENVKFIYENAKPSTKGGGKAAVRSMSFSDLGRMFGIHWSDVQCISRGYAFAWITGADRGSRKVKMHHQPAQAYEAEARSKLSDEQVRFIRLMARPGPLNPKAPLTYASLGEKYGLPERVVRAVKLRQMLADIPDGGEQ